jgi:hypothetical protein
MHEDKKRVTKNCAVAVLIGLVASAGLWVVGGTTPIAVVLFISASLIMIAFLLLRNRLKLGSLGVATVALAALFWASPFSDLSRADPCPELENGTYQSPCPEPGQPKFIEELRKDHRYINGDYVALEGILVPFGIVLGFLAWYAHRHDDPLAMMYKEMALTLSTIAVAFAPMTVTDAWNFSVISGLVIPLVFTYCRARATMTLRTQPT